MKKFNELTPEQQAKAEEKALNQLLEDICNQRIRFNDELNEDDLQARIDEAGRKAEAMHTPWFWSEYIMETCAEDLKGMARCTAEDALYAEPGERVIKGVL
jgi:hypothetical protein